MVLVCLASKTFLYRFFPLLPFDLWSSQGFPLLSYGVKLVIHVTQHWVFWIVSQNSVWTSSVLLQGNPVNIASCPLAKPIKSQRWSDAFWAIVLQRLPRICQLQPLTVESCSVEFLLPPPSKCHCPYIGKERGNPVYPFPTCGGVVARNAVLIFQGILQLRHTVSGLLYFKNNNNKTSSCFM